MTDLSNIANLTEPNVRHSRVLAVVLNWNGQEMSRKCVEHLRRQEYAALDLLLVDNGSTDGSVLALETDGLRPNELLRLSDNRGFSGGMNAGIEVALAGSYDHVWVLNNDAFPKPDCLSKLVRVLEENPRDAIVSPCLVGADGKEQPIGMRVLWDTLRINDVFLEEISGVMPEDSWLTGAALLIRTQSLRELGPYDDRFFAYHEDSDLCLRYRRGGWTVRVAKEATCVHLGGSTSGGYESPFVAFMMTRNYWHFVAKNLPARGRLWARFTLVSKSLRDAAGLHSIGRAETASALIAAAFAIVRGETGPPTRLAPAPKIGRFLLKHWWGITRGLDRIASLLPSPSRTCARDMKINRVID